MFYNFCSIIFFLSFRSLSSHIWWVCLDRTYFAETENWKHYSKIIVKCVISTVEPIFNEKVDKKWSLWDALFTKDRSTVATEEEEGKKKKEREKTQTQHLNVLSKHTRCLSFCGWNLSIFSFLPCVLLCVVEYFFFK